MNQNAQLRQAIAHLEAQRLLLGGDVSILPHEAEEAHVPR
jgi:hypothetical protein